MEQPHWTSTTDHQNVTTTRNQPITITSSLLEKPREVGVFFLEKIHCIRKIMACSLVRGNNGTSVRPEKKIK